MPDALAMAAAEAVIDAVAMPAPTGPRPIPRDQAVALFAKWYDAHEGDQEATFVFQVRDGGRVMDVTTSERLVREL